MMNVKAKCWNFIGKEIWIKSKTILAMPEMVPACCYYIQSGKVIAYSENESGLKQAYCMFKEGEIILAQELLCEKESKVYFETIETVKAYMISKCQLIDALKKDVMVYEDILDATMRFNDRLLDSRMNEQQGNAASRLSNLFLELAQSYGVEEDGDIVIHQKISQDVLGQLTGLHRVTVVREIKKMQEKKLIYRKMPWYVIPDMRGLQEYRNQQCG